MRNLVLVTTMPDGQVTEYELDQTTTVGRASGNGVVLEHPSVERHHARIEVAELGGTITDLGSSTGTQLNDAPLEPYASTPISVGDRLLFGEVRAVLSEASVGTHGLDGEAQSAIVKIQVPPLALIPGETASVVVSIENIGSVVDSFALSVTDLPQNWIRIAQRSVKLMPQTSSTISIDVSPPRLSESRAGEWPFWVEVEAETTGRVIRVAGSVEIQAFDSLRMQARKSGAETEINIENRGNRIADVRLTCQQTPDTPVLSLAPTEVHIEPGSAESVLLVFSNASVRASIHYTVTATTMHSELTATTEGVIDSPDQVASKSDIGKPGRHTRRNSRRILLISSGAVLVVGALGLATLFAAGNVFSRQTRTPPASITSEPSLVYDFVDSAGQAVWTDHPRNARLSFPGSDVDRNGFALWRFNVQLEDGGVRARVLETHPQWVADGQISGQFTLPRPLRSGDRLEARVGFIRGAGGTVEFRVAVAIGGQLITVATERDSGQDGQLRTISVDLSNFVGAQTVTLTVDADGSSGQDWAVWESAQILHK